MAMVFDRWLDTLIRELGLSNSQIAGYGGIDRSLVSRFRTGVRTPASDHEQLHKLIKGLVLASEAAGNLDLLQRLCGAANPEETAERLYRDACSRLPKNDTLPSSIARSVSRRSFAVRLTELMDGLNVSSAKLARVLNIDSSLVSRWRSGMRLLKEDNPLMTIMCRYFAHALSSIDTADSDDTDPEFYARLTTELGTDKLAGNPNLDLEIRRWLLAEEQTLDKTRQWVDEFIQYAIQNAGRPSSNEPDPQTLLNKFNRNKALAAILKSASTRTDKSNYQGIQGMREAVLRFLLDVTMSREPCLLKLFSTQGMDWLVTDPDFMCLWGFLMQLLLKKGHRIEIIHNFGRSETEVMGAIKYWLPLYMSGNIDPYTCDSFNQPGFSAVPFVKTLFINCGRSAISGEFFQGTENETYFRYLSNPESLGALEQQFDFLKEKSERIASFVRGEDRIEAYLRSKIDLGENCPVGSPPLTELCSAYPLYTCSRELLEKALTASKKLDDGQRERIRTVWAGARPRFEHILDHAEYRMVAPLTELHGAKSRREINLFSLGMPPLPISDKMLDQYVDDLHELAARKPNFRLFPIEIAPFDRLNIFSQKDRFVMIMVMGETPHLIEVKHSLVRGCFQDYLAPFTGSSQENDG